MAEPQYIKLTPRRQHAGFAVISVTRSNLWLGKDHLLCVETEGYTERYKRFYFRDIQAVTIRRTNRFLILTAVLGGMTAIFGALTLATSAVELRWVLGVIAAVCAVPFVINLIYGPTCTCQLRTAVQTENVPSLSRVARAQRVLARIRPLIAEAQGQLAPEEISVRFQELMRPAAAAPAGSAPPAIEATAAPPPAP